MGAGAAIPAGKQGPGFRTRGMHRKHMGMAFGPGPVLKAYGQGSKTGTMFSMIKRMLGSSVSSRSARVGEAEMPYRVPACNCHRACHIMCCLSDDFDAAGIRSYLYCLNTFPNT